MRYDILDDLGNVIKSIIAETGFVEEKYPGKYRLVPENNTPLKRLDFRAIISSLPLVKRKALWAAKANNADVQDFIEMVALNGSAFVTDQWVIDGIAACVSAGILTAAQANNLLGA